MTQNVRALIGEDSEDDAGLLVYELKKGGYDVEWVRVDTAVAMEDALRNKQWDLVISDYAMPGFNGLSALNLTRKIDPDLPFIMVSGVIDEDTAVGVMKAGAQDFITKGRYARLVPAIERELSEAAVRLQHRRDDEQHLEEEKKFQAMIDAAYDAIMLIRDERIVEMNSGTPDLFLYPTKEQLLGVAISTLFGPSTPEGGNTPAEFSRMLLNAKAGDAQATEWIFKRSDGSLFDTDVRLSQVVFSKDRAVLAIIRDSTERKKNERAMYKQMEEIAELQQHTFTMIEQNPLPILLMDLDLNITSANRAYLKMSGLSADQLKSMSAKSFKILEKSGHGLREALQTKMGVTGHVTVKFPSGVHNLEQHTIPLLDKEERIVNIMSVYSDITEKLERDKQLNQSVGELAESLAAVARGNLTLPAKTYPGDPLGQVKADQNETISQLRQTMEQISKQAVSLEEVVIDVGRGAEELAQSTRQVASTAQRTADGVKTQRDQLDRVTGEVSDLSSSIEEIASTSSEVRGLSLQVMKEGNEAAALGSEATDRMKKVEAISSEAVRQITHLNQKLGEISKIVRLITEIANQTNLLALNAAIEAARAGEHGRGFAVVAGEVRSLAGESKQATTSIEDVIGEITTSSEKTAEAMNNAYREVIGGIEIVNKAISALNNLTADVGNTVNGIADISKATEEQANATNNMTRSVDRVNELMHADEEQMVRLTVLSEESSSSTEEVANAASRMKVMAVELKGLVQQFTLK
ncbi:methyl-accepting chemotaxis protein [Methanosphaerula palustris]|uniref:Methyl-accepting chemotaxis sensory transducer with Pas/Pac sensor n=1 Tax=Methanosphaerula palustris (strain ATCC BAA-1556 / DSM 19958 / E1-9c) TaxID=521011 RepID=B8GK08_METPE|nr:methyl-accepting chemotaxis protein [Methanosphaerula palustris]ACL17079.1 methyl-accepting chemotaxis sensory transducer with Pas/Pac sensor [Methanosphaerula palustris E1-9c]